MRELVDLAAEMLHNQTARAMQQLCQDRRAPRDTEAAKGTPPRTQAPRQRRVAWPPPREDATNRPRSSAHRHPSRTAPRATARRHTSNARQPAERTFCTARRNNDPRRCDRNQPRHSEGVRDSEAPVKKGLRLEHHQHTRAQRTHTHTHREQRGREREWERRGDQTSACVAARP